MAQTGKRNDQTTTQARASDSRASVVRTERHHGQHQEHLIGTNTSGYRRPRWSAAKERPVWGNEKVQWSGVGGKDDVGRVNRTTKKNPAAERTALK